MEMDASTISKNVSVAWIACRRTDPKLNRCAPRYTLCGLGSKCDQRIDLGGASRRKISSQQRNDEKQQGNGNKR